MADYWLNEIEYKRVTFLGKYIDVPKNTNYIVVNKDGCAYGYQYQPEPDEYNGIWVCNGEEGMDFGVYIGEVELDGSDWKCCIKGV